ncbi:hypothetical protein E2986_14013 [Frieseomelitta varia]|uniref:Uncharacterized protein n=1 Tax=Frieseomelitta varia TaxID=561572 RepID=A0A833RR67_9HYME|nr:hypothetical protein E2986_14013 [Frieseomelitta varia]
MFLIENSGTRLFCKQRAIECGRVNRSNDHRRATVLYHTVQNTIDRDKTMALESVSAAETLIQSRSWYISTSIEELSSGIKTEGKRKFV